MKITGIARRLNIILMIFTIICVGIQLFVNPYIGLANNGDFGRLSFVVGLDYLEDPYLNYEQSFIHYMIPTFKFITPMETGFVSSASLLLKIAVALHYLFAYDTNIFDIRWLGLVYFLIYTIAIILAFNLIKKMKFLKSIIIGIFLFCFFTDVTHVVYFNTFYGEAASLVFLVLFFTLAFTFITCDCFRSIITVYICEIICAYFFLLAKYQNILSLFGILIILCMQLDRILKQPQLKHIFKLKFMRIGTIICLNLLFTIPVFVCISLPNSSNAPTTANVVLKDILLLSKEPEKILTSAGYSEKEIALIKPHIGYNIFEGDPDPELKTMFYDSTKFNRSKEIKMLLTEPEIFFRLITLKDEQLFRFPKYGTHHKGYNTQPDYFDQRFSAYSKVSQVITWNHWCFYVSVMMLIVFYAVRKILYFKDSNYFLFYCILLVACLISFLSAVTVILGDSSADSIKHFYLTNETFYFAFYYTVGDLFFNSFYKKFEISKIIKR
ncbi:glycan biosynthesis hexose transferase WsfD [Lacrimispora sp.]|uniref:glycan biosynthesis hexose transferase WsfD n=1 Tax=Lacrimispora sp. TaxID=2719234 RepID=UPI003FA601AF